MKLFHLLLVGHLLFVFCAIDYLHTDDCPAENGPVDVSETGCPACLFKQGANSEQPTVEFTLDFNLAVEQKIIEVVEQIKSIEPYSSCSPRAPPA
jgi:hypothetical protein